MTLLVALNSNVSWTALAKVLELPVTSEATPARTDCPFCAKRRMYVFKDSISGGFWHYCYDCRHSGDLIELAAGVWGMSPQAAVKRLAAHGFAFPSLDADVIEGYVSQITGNRNRFQTLWAKARQQLAMQPSSTLARLRDRFKLLGQFSTERWLDGPGKFLGGAHVKQVESMLFPEGSINQYGRALCSRRIFRGRKWTDVLMVPFYAAPDYICGAWFIGRDGRPDSRVYTGMRYPSVTEAGLAGLTSIEDSRGQFGPYVFAVDDPLIMLRLQVRHMQVSTLPLPIVTYQDNARYRTASAWTALLHNKVILFTAKITPALVYQAMQTDADISLMPLDDPTKKSIGHYLRLAAPRDVLRKAVRNALPWRQALAKWVDQAQPGALEELLLGLSPYEIDVQRFSKDVGAHLQTPSLMPRIRSVQTPNYECVDRPDGWYIYRPGRTARTVMRLLTDAKITVKRIVMGEIPRYEGFVEFRGQTIPYSVPVSQANYRAKNWLTMLCLRAGVGRPNVHDAKKSLFEIAIALSPPEEVSSGPTGPKTSERV